MINMAKNVLIGPSDALSAPEVAWSLVNYGFEVTAFSVRGRRSSLEKIKEISFVFITDPEIDAYQSLEDLGNVIIKGNFAIFLPLTDFAVWMYSKLSHILPYLEYSVSNDSVDLTIDKWKQIELAVKSGMFVPETLCCNSSDEALSNSYYPCFVKSSVAVGISEGKLLRDPCYVCGCQDEFKHVVARWDFSRPMLIQPCLTGRGEGVFGLATDTEINWWSAHRRIRMMNPQGSGSSACEAIVPDSSVLPAIQRFLLSNSWKGIFMIEFLRDDDGKLWFMEINGRAWGSMALARRGGYEYPAWMVQSLLDLNFKPAIPSPVLPLRCRHLGRELIHLLLVIKGPKSTKAVPSWPSFWKTLRDMLTWRSYDHWYNWNSKYPAVFWRDSFLSVYRAVFKK